MSAAGPGSGPEPTAPAQPKGTAPGTTRLLTKRSVFLMLVLPSLVLLLAATRTWVTGRSTDPVLGQATVAATGAQAAPGVAALGAVALVAVVAVLTGGRRIRRVSSVLLVLAALAATLLTAAVVADPTAALGRLAAGGLGRTGSVDTTAARTAWPWVALLAGVALTAASVVATVAVGRWQGLSSRFETPAGGVDRRGARRTAWDDLSEGHDPTVDSDEGRT